MKKNESKIMEIQNLNVENLDIQELENRLELSTLEASEAGWVRICDGRCAELGQCTPYIIDPQT